MSTNISENISIVEYILSLEDKSQKKEDIALVKNSIKTTDDAMYILNSILEVEKTKIDDNVETELKFIKAQYKALGFNTFLNIKFISNLIELYLRKQDMKNDLKIEDKLNLISNAINEVKECKDNKVKNDIYQICLRYITENKLITVNRELTLEVLDYCKSISEEEKYLTILPDELLGL